MSGLHITTREGEEKHLVGAAGLSVMEIMRDGGVDELLALCGGSCSCATCHVYVDPAFAPRLPQMAADENELLVTSPHRRAESRLACQIRFDDTLAGLRVTVALED